MGNASYSERLSKTTGAIGKAIKKNKVNLKYGTFVYIINSKEQKQN